MFHVKHISFSKEFQCISATLRGNKPLHLKLRRLGFSRIEGLSSGRGEVEINPGILGDSPVLVGTGLRNFIEGFAEHGVVSLFSIQKKVDGFANTAVIDLTVQVLIDHLGPLFAGDVGQQIAGQIPGFVQVSCVEGIAGGVY